MGRHFCSFAMIFFQKCKQLSNTLPVIRLLYSIILNNYSIFLYWLVYCIKSGTPRCAAGGASVSARILWFIADGEWGFLVFFVEQLIDFLFLFEVFLWALVRSGVFHLMIISSLLK